MTEQDLEAKVKELSEKLESLEKNLEFDLTGYSLVCSHCNDWHYCFKEGEKVSLSMMKTFLERKAILMPSSLYHSSKPIKEGLIS